MRGIEAVLHCAAKSLVGESIADPAIYYRHTVVGGVALMAALRDAALDAAGRGGPHWDLCGLRSTH